MKTNHRDTEAQREDEKKSPGPSPVVTELPQREIDEIKRWLVNHLQSFYGPRYRWTKQQQDKFLELFGLLYCFAMECKGRSQ